MVVTPDEAETPLARQLKERIRRDGPLPFHDFMEAALYDPDHGYYTRGPAIGPEGDFSTSVGFPAFREAMARLVRRAWESLGKPDAFRVVELGAGTGLLARGVTEAWRRDVPDVPLDYVTVERSPTLRAKQEEVEGVRSVAAPEALDSAPGLVFGNEVLDAFPVHRVVGGPNGVLEIAVDVEATTGRFCDRLVHLTRRELAKRLQDEGVSPQRGQILDVAPALPGFVEAVARLPDPGFLVFIDYGDPAEELYAATRLNGTLAAYKSHGKFHDPYEDVGRRDLTADVDFTCVAYAATRAGLEELGLASQQEFLEALGIEELGMPDEVRLVAGAAGLGSAFKVAAFRRGTDARLPGF